MGGMNDSEIDYYGPTGPSLRRHIPEGGRMKITLTTTDGTEREVEVDDDADLNAFRDNTILGELQPGDRAQVGAWYAVPEVKPGHAMSVMPDGTIVIRRLETE